jgi:hypothetical protein
MGDGHHVWAAAEWLLMIRNCFVREENDHLVLAAGVPVRWLDASEVIRFGAAPTSFGAISLVIRPRQGQGVLLEWRADWHTVPGPKMEIKLAGYAAITIAAAEATGSAMLTETEI